MLIIGLTGGIGSGKSTVASLFAERQIPVIDADIIARQMTQPGTTAFSKISQHFPDMLLANGHLDRTKLRHFVFNHPDERLWLEKLLHPMIRKEIETQITQLSSPYCIVVIPLLLESGSYAFIDRILVVDAPEETQINRVLMRDKSEKNQIEAIIRTQMDRKTRLAKATDIIMNDGILEDLVPQVEKLHRKYLDLVKKE